MHPSTAEASRLLLWFSPSFPTGAFGYSHGLEWAVEAGDVTDQESLAEWIAAILEHGGGWSDAVVLSAAHGAALAEDADALGAIAELAFALQPSSERRLETEVQGRAFLKAVATGWPQLRVAHFGPEAAITLPVAVGACAAHAGLSLDATLAAYLTGLAANLVSAAIRLAPIGQSDGLRVLAALEPVIARLAAGASRASLDDIGTCALRSDIASMRHETQMTRLFRS
jgi:urease accessory protein